VKRGIVLPTLLIVAGLVVLAGRAPSGYYVIAPGDTYEVEPRLHIPSDHRELSGRLAFTAVFAGPGRWLDVVNAWIDPVAEAVPIEQVRPHGMSQRELNEINQRLIGESKSVAAVVALQAAGYDARITGQGALVNDVLVGMPASTALEPGDVIVAVDGQPVQTAVEVIELTRRHEVGDEVRLEITRNGERRGVVVGTVGSPQEPERPVIGAAISTHQFDVVLPFPVEIDTGNVGGPSAGAIFALGILDAVTEGVLTRGHFVAGTGTIAVDGTVGPIDGAAQKVVAAERDGADLFLAPRQNYEEARRTARTIRVEPIDRLEDAVRVLCQLEPVGDAPPTPPAPCTNELGPGVGAETVRSLRGVACLACQAPPSTVADTDAHRSTKWSPSS
jgi:Lon-like protease